MKKLISMFLMSAIVMSMGACSSGPSDDEYRKLAAENARLQVEVEDLTAQIQELQRPTVEATPPETVEASDDASQQTNSLVIFEQDSIKVTYTGMSETFMGPKVDFIVENGTDTDITLQARNVSVNGVMTDPTFSCEVTAGKKAKDGISFLADDIDGGVIKELEFSFHIFKTDGWDTILDSDMISISI